MKLKSVLFGEQSQEGFIGEHPIFFDNLVKAQTQCKKFLSEMWKSKQSLVRASNNVSDSYFRKPYSTERNPVDNERFNDDWIEEFRKQNYPKYPSRKKATFAEVMSLNTKKAEMPFAIRQYGSIGYFIIPKDSSKIFQNQKVRDFLGSDINNYIGYHNDRPDSKPIYNALIIHAKSYFRNGKTKLSEMIPDREVVIEHKGYYAFNMNTWEEYATEVLKSNLVEVINPTNLKVINSYL